MICFSIEPRAKRQAEDGAEKMRLEESSIAEWVFSYTIIVLWSMMFTYYGHLLNRVADECHIGEEKAANE